MSDEHQEEHQEDHKEDDLQSLATNYTATTLDTLQSDAITVATECGSVQVSGEKIQQLVNAWEKRKKKHRDYDKTYRERKKQELETLRYQNKELKAQCEELESALVAIQSKTIKGGTILLTNTASFDPTQRIIKTEEDYVKLIDDLAATLKDAGIIKKYYINGREGGVDEDDPKQKTKTKTSKPTQ